MNRMSQIDGATRMQRDMRLFRELRSTIRGAGCMKPAPVAIGIHMLITLSIYFSAYVVLLNDPAWTVRFAMLLAIAFASVQAGYIAHEVGHLSFSRNAAVSRFLAHVFMTFVSGYGHSVYKEKHNSHHAHINEDEEDPDVSGGGLFTFYEGAAKSKRGKARWFTSHQRILVWFLYGLIPFASKKDSIIRYIGGGRSSTRTGQVMLALHFLLWFSVPVFALGLLDALVNFALAGWLMGPYLGCVILLNHIGTRHLPADHGMSHFRRAALTTRNFEPGFLSSYLTGGTNNHLEHHLFPTIPICRLGKARQITQQFCNEHGFPYQETTWLTAQKDTLNHLDAMSRYARAVWENQADHA